MLWKSGRSQVSLSVLWNRSRALPMHLAIPVERDSVQIHKHTRHVEDCVGKGFHKACRLQGSLVSRSSVCVQVSQIQVVVVSDPPQLSSP